MTRELDIPEAELDGVINGIDFLLNANLGYRVDLGKKVIVIGGGNVAVDVARTVTRIGDEG
jgi:NADPH-dependent glutamate synthase beta subunit-like oxidoreductase